MSRFRSLVAVAWSAWRSIAGRLTIWFTATALLMVLAKSLATYLMVAPGITEQEQAYVVARAELIAARLHGIQTPLEARSRLDADDAAIGPDLIRLIAPDAEILGESPEMPSELAVSDFPSSGQPTVVRGKSGRRYWGATAVAQPGRFVIQVATEANEFRLLAPTGGGVWLAVTMGLMLCGIAGHQIARHGIRPLQELVDVTHAIGGSALERRINTDRLPTELLPLGETFNGMLDRLQQAFDRVSQFTDDIAHELRTPLTIMTSEIDVALAGERTAPEYREVLESSREEIGALSELVHRLLFLSRAENQSVVLKTERLDVAKQLAAAQEFYEPLATEAGVELIAAGADTPILITGDRVLLQRAIGNLLVNAIGHTPAGGRIVLAAQRQTDAVRLTISDDGCGIDAEHLARVFDRFYRIDEARMPSEGHVGLGLAIAKAIVTLHRGTIEIASTVGVGTTVAICIPPEWAG